MYWPLDEGFGEEGAVWARRWQEGLSNPDGPYQPSCPQDPSQQGPPTGASAPHTHLPTTMGQQQLLLLVLGIVIVGLAVVVGIQAFGENQRKANNDALVNDGIRIASDAQAWALKPTAFGGGDGDFLNGADDMTMQDLGYQPDANDIYSNVNGNFEVTVTDAQNIVIEGCSRSAFGNQDVDDGTTVTNEDSFNKITVTVSGFGAGDITTSSEAAVAGDCPTPA